MRDDEASATAMRVLQGLLYTATRLSTAHLVTPEARDAAARVLAASPRGAALLRSIDGPRRLFVPVLERLLLPGISLHYALRKRWIEEQVRAALAGGARQLIVLGAGLDTLALRLAREDPRLRCVEVDHPASQALKARALAAEDAPRNLELLAVDFTRETLAERLPSAAGFEPETPSVVVCEGVLAYLDEAETGRLFASLRDLLRGGVTVAFTFIAPASPTGRRPYGPLLGAYLRLAGEGLRLQLSPGELASLLSREGFTLDEVTIGPELLDRYGASTYRGAVHDLEMLARASAPAAPAGGVPG